MTPAEHYREAERLLSLSSFMTADPATPEGGVNLNAELVNGSIQRHLVAMARVHAELAKVGATLVGATPHGPDRAALISTVLGSARRVDQGPD